MLRRPRRPTSPVIDRDREAVGMNTRWLPFGDDCDWVRRHFAVIGGYEYGTEHYQQRRRRCCPNSLTYRLYGPRRSLRSSPSPTRSRTRSPSAWKRSGRDCFQTYVRYKWIGTHYPFIGVTPAVDSSQQRP